MTETLVDRYCRLYNKVRPEPASGPFNVVKVGSCGIMLGCNCSEEAARWWLAYYQTTYPNSRFQLTEIKK